MVRLASIQHKGTTKLVAQISDRGDFVDLSSIAPHSRAFFEKESALKEAKELISSSSAGTSSIITASEARMLVPLDPSTCG